VRSENSSSGISVGVSIGVGITGISATPSISLSASKGSSQSSETTQRNTNISAGNALTINSGRDTTLSGAVAQGRNVDVNVGRNLTIESLQDRASSESSSVGVNLGISGPSTDGVGVLEAAGLRNTGAVGNRTGDDTGGAISAGGVSLGVSVSDGKSNSAIVTEQSGILSRGGDLNINVAERTEIVGAVVAALDEDGKDTGRLTLNTGSLTVTDIKDSAISRDISVGVSANINDPFEQGIKGANTPVVDGSFASSTFKQDTKGTIGAGAVIVGGDADSSALTGVNRDIDAAQVVTKDKTSGFTVYLDEAALREAAALATGDVGNSTILRAADEIAKDFDGNTDTASTLISQFRQIGKELKQARALSRIYDDLENDDITRKEAVNLLIEKTAEFLEIDINEKTSATVTVIDDETGQPIEKTVTIDNREVVATLVLANITSRAADDASGGELRDVDRLLVQEVASRAPSQSTGTPQSRNDEDPPDDEIVVIGTRIESDQKLLKRANKGVVNKTANLIRPITRRRCGTRCWHRVN